MRRSVAVLLVSLLLPAGASQPSAGEPLPAPPDILPANIRVDKILSTVMADMLEGSSTFREQVRRLGAERRVRVTIAFDPPSLGGAQSCPAECVLKRYQYGRVEAAIRVRALHDAARLIAHELEHVLEFVEGVSYAALSVQTRGQVWLLAPGVFETSRAVAAGDRVAGEMKQHHRAARAAGAR